MLPWYNRFILYGMIGWSLEIIFTCIYSLVDGSGDARLLGVSYLWMFPIWAIGFFIADIAQGPLKAAGIPYMLRMWGYVLNCYLIEYGAGALIRYLFGTCPWDYSEARFNVHGLIRLDYMFFWYTAAMFAEWFTSVTRRIRILTKEEYPKCQRCLEFK